MNVFWSTFLKLTVSKIGLNLKLNHRIKLSLFKSLKGLILTVAFFAYAFQYGEIRSISMVSKGSCAFIQFVKRSAAEVAAEKTFNKLVSDIIESSFKSRWLFL